MENILVPEVCTLAIGRLPIVGRPIWRLTEGKHIVKLEITWQLPRTSPQRKPTNKISATKQDDARVKMAGPKMAAPTPPSLAASFNDAVCLTPSPTMEARRAPQDERPSTPTSAADLETTTDRSPPGEWKEVVSKKKKKILRASTPKEEPPAPPRRRTPPMEQPRKIQRTMAPRTPSPPAPAPVPVPASTPLPKSQEKAKCFLSGCGRSYPIHEKYDLDEVRTLRMANGRQGTIIRAYRLPDEDGRSTEEAPVFFTAIESQPYWYFLKGPSSKYYSKRFNDDIQEKFAGATPVDNNMIWYDDLERCCAGTDHPKRLARLGP